MKKLSNICALALLAGGLAFGCNGPDNPNDPGCEAVTHVSSGAGSGSIVLGVIYSILASF